jgi:hypothetical protein
MKNIISIITFILLTHSISFLNAQGCSDAGFCTINSFKPQNNDSTKHYKNQLKLGISYGKADKSIIAIATYIEYNRAINDKFSFDLKITGLNQNGNNISRSGLSDIFINANFSLKKQLKTIVGLKLPLSSSNEMLGIIPLPMDYQSSLGTVDLIIGSAYQLKKLQFVIAIQQPLTQNKNEFIAENYPLNSPLRNFQSTNKFKRSGDVLIRCSYPFNMNDKIKITPSILPIYHLTEDSYTDISGNTQTIKNSEGLTLNGNIYFDYELNARHALQLNVGAPFIVRQARPDGLTRSFIANIEYRIKF